MKREQLSQFYSSSSPSALPNTTIDGVQLSSSPSNQSGEHIPSIQHVTPRNLFAKLARKLGFVSIANSKQHQTRKKTRTYANPKNAILALATVSACTLALAGCGTGNNNAVSEQNIKTSHISFMLDWTPNTNHIGLYVAKKIGYFAKNHVDVRILPTAQAGAETSVENGLANVGFTTLSNVAAFNAQGSHLTFVFDLTQHPVARWCALQSRKDIVTPKDLSGKTFVSFGSAEQSAIVSQMIKYAGGTGKFTTATAGTNTFATLTSGKGDFAGFYDTWEGVESRLNGPALHCFIASNWGVPGNPDQLGFAVKTSWLKDPAHKQALRRFIRGAQEGYNYALQNPDKAAKMLVDETPESHIDLKLAQASMKDIVKNHYWSTNDDKKLSGITNLKEAQAYLNFQYHAGTYTTKDGKPATEAPQASKLSTDEFINK